MSKVEQFFAEIDQRWKWAGADKVLLQIIGSGALMLQANYERGTKDSDVLETIQLTADTKHRLLEIAGPGTALHKRHRLYIDIVQSGLPFLPQLPRWHRLAEFNKTIQNFEIEALDIVDVVVSKLKRFNANDRLDIEAMIDTDLVSHGQLIIRFRTAIEFNQMDARATEFPKYVDNLHRVERDSFGVTETEIELPSWI